MRTFPVILEWDSADSVWVSHVPSLDYLSTYGETREGVLENTREAILGYLEAADKEGRAIPPPSRAELVDIEVAV